MPTALGGNVSRLDQYVAGPLLACALLPRRRMLLVVVAVPLLDLAVVPGRRRHRVRAHRSVDARSRTTSRSSTYPGQPAAGGPIGRVEIPSTYRHWEAAYAAPKVLLARGWERQLDIAYNPIFYSSR